MQCFACDKRRAKLVVARGECGNVSPVLNDFPVAGMLCLRNENIPAKRMLNTPVVTQWIAAESKWRTLLLLFIGLDPVIQFRCSEVDGLWRFKSKVYC